MIIIYVVENVLKLGNIVWIVFVLFCKMDKFVVVWYYRDFFWLVFMFV